MYKVIIAGTRDFADYVLLCSFVDEALATACGGNLASAEINRNKRSPQCGAAPIEVAGEALAGMDDIEIVSGGARGADALGERYAREHGHALKVFPADWKKWGRAAGPIRNGQMADYADALIAFWDGQSAGTRDMIRKAEDRGLRVQVRMI